MYTTFSRRKVEDMANLLGGEYSFQFVTNFWWNMYDTERAVLDGRYIDIYTQIDGLLEEKLHSLYFSQASILQELVCCTQEYRSTLFFYGIDLIHAILFSSNSQIEDLFMFLLYRKKRNLPSRWCLFSKLGSRIGLRYLLPENRWYNKVSRLEIIQR